MKNLLIVCLVVFATLGCTELVPPGYVGVIFTPKGFSGEALQPGRHECFGRDRMILIETQEMTTKETMSILAKDDLNFSFDLVLKTRPTATNSETIKEVLNRQGAKLKAGILETQTLYTTYVRPAARSIARTTVSKYDTTEIRENREQIQTRINKKLAEALKGTPIELIAAYTSNFDYPDVITKAVERKREKQIEIQEEEARQAMKLLQAKNRQAVAKAERVTKAMEAEAEAAYMKIIGDALTPTYLDRLKIQVEQQKVQALETLYSKVGQGDKIIMTNGTEVIPVVK